MISDEQQIKNLIFAVSLHRDRGEFDEMAEIFAHATFQTHYPAGYPGVGVPPEEYESRGPGGHGVQEGASEVSAIFKRLTRVYEEDLPHTHYVATNVMIEIDDDGTAATTWSYYTAYQSRPGFALQPIAAGRYHDAFERVDGTWRFRSRDIYADHSGDLSHHMTLDPIAYGREFDRTPD
jgi:SnoaL-like domain